MEQSPIMVNVDRLVAFQETNWKRSPFHEQRRSSRLGLADSQQGEPRWSNQESHSQKAGTAEYAPQQQSLHKNG